MEGLSGVTVRERAIVLDNVLVVADLHVGRGSASNVELPVGDGSDMIQRLSELCQEFNPGTVIVAGDLLHSFNTIPRQVERTVDGLQSVVSDLGAELVVTPGNHDTMLDTVWSGPTTQEYKISGTGTVVCHGHVEPEMDAQRYIIGHDHPTISIEGQRLPCHLASQEAYQGAALLMLPSFNRLVRGVEVNDMSSSDFMSPLVCDAGSLAPALRDTDARETLTFPTLEEFRHRL
ncbi:metallophosphoesterase [Halovenus rubra]|uniref:Metallophosphoesterase n=2 Tax=Halovenus rubra TaxID=869890 RepID=A0ABD5XAX5_9EURY|nr:metallophosphoesterase [Halovenus rubra]